MLLVFGREEGSQLILKEWYSLRDFMVDADIAVRDAEAQVLDKSEREKLIPTDLYDEICLEGQEFTPSTSIQYLNKDSLQASIDFQEEILDCEPLYQANGPVTVGSPNFVVSNYVIDGTRERIVTEGLSKTMVIGAQSKFARGSLGLLAHNDLVRSDQAITEAEKIAYYGSAVTAVSIRSSLKEFQRQDFLYTNAVRRLQDGREVIEYEVNGSYVEGIEAINLEGFKKAVDKFRKMNMVALAIDKKGYYCQPNKGEIDFNDPNVQFDLKLVDDFFKIGHANIDSLKEPPKTIFGFLAIAVEYARQQHEFSSPLGQNQVITLPVIVPLDNLPVYVGDKFGAVGDYTKNSLTLFLSKIGINSDFITANLRTPNTMVDKITADFEPNDVLNVFETHGFIDVFHVPSEPKPDWGALFIDKYVMKDGNQDSPVKFTFADNQMPAWLQRFGNLNTIDPNDINFQRIAEASIYTKDATVWAELKSRSINTTHIILAWFGKELGMEDRRVHEIMEVPGMEEFLRYTLTQEILPLIKDKPLRLTKNPQGINRYIDDVVSRMKNSAHPDNISRLNTNSSTKIPDRLLGIIAHSLKLSPDDEAKLQGAKIMGLALVAAVWLKLAVTRVDCNGNPVVFKDSFINPPEGEGRSIFHGLTNPLDRDQFNQLMDVEMIFGSLGHNEVFRDEIYRMLRRLDNYGLQKMLEPAFLNRVISRVRRLDEIKSRSE